MVTVDRPHQERHHSAVEHDRGEHEDEEVSREAMQKAIRTRRVRDITYTGVAVGAVTLAGWLTFTGPSPHISPSQAGLMAAGLLVVIGVASLVFLLLSGEDDPAIEYAALRDAYQKLARAIQDKDDTAQESAVAELEDATKKLLASV